MVPQSNVNNMSIKTATDKRKYARKSILCISIATLIGLIVYSIFLYFNIAIVGWNLGLIFAPLGAGYSETILSRRIVGEDIGAISAFILFIYTTFYSFILKNPTLGFNIITILSIAVILQAAFPTLVNYILFTGVIGGILRIIRIFKNITRFIYNKIKLFVYKHIIKKPLEVKPEIDYSFDEEKSNELLNSQKFYFITNTNTGKKVINLGLFNATAIVDKANIRNASQPEKFEAETLYNLKKGKDDCLLKLVEKVKAKGGNGIIDLDIQYSLIGIGGENYQVTALGMGVYISKS